MTHNIYLRCEFGFHGKVSIERHDFPTFYSTLFSVGARVNAKDNMWLTPLHRAVASRSEVNTHTLTHYTHVRMLEMSKYFNGIY